MDNDNKVPWHASFAFVATVFLVTALVTSPCWAFLIFVAVTR